MRRKVECEKTDEVVVEVPQGNQQGTHQMLGSHQRSFSEVGAVGPSPYLEDPRTRFSPFRYKDIYIHIYIHTMYMSSITQISSFNPYNMKKLFSNSYNYSRGLD